MRSLKRSALIILLATTGLCAGALLLTQQQGLRNNGQVHYKNVTIDFDAEGIPTLVGHDWSELLEAQGYVVAGNRLWQMDLIRRKVGGRLSAWFGDKALEHDKKVQSEDRLAIAQREADAMSPRDRSFCDAFAKGVNAFIDHHFGRWGLEYILLRTKPEAWTCRDSLLVLLEMNDSLTAGGDNEIAQYRWKRHLPESWQNFLFGYVHPWNHPYFDAAKSKSFVFPSGRDYVRKGPIEEVKTASLQVVDPAPIGSNSWAWTGETGSFLANDPHLAYMVPALWYAVRLRIDAQNWVVGAALPGIPGVVIGMNPNYAWSFTNSGEDVDDYLEESLSPDGELYLADIKDGKKIWEPVQKKTFSIEVRGRSKPEVLEARFTRRGPLSVRPELEGRSFSRQWLPLKEGMLRLPTLDILLGHNLDEFQEAIHGMRVPSQNAVVMDRAGTILYRMTGTGVIRRVPGNIPQAALVGEWQGYAPMQERHSLTLEPTSKNPVYLATANERIWVDPFGGNWASEDRKERINQVLAQKEFMSQRDMENLQRDTHSRFRQMLLRWLATYAEVTDVPVKEHLNSWKSWDGNSQSDSKIFAEAEFAEMQLSELLLNRVRKQFLGDADQSAPYVNYSRRSWMTALLEAKDERGVAAFGLTRQELASYIVDKVWEAQSQIEAHEVKNAMQTQHPFAERIPVLGRIFATAKPLQWGAQDLVLAERPAYGPSMRLVWNLRNPMASTWSFPVGQSGHALTAHFKDFQAVWSEPARLKALDPRYSWENLRIASPEKTNRGTVVPKGEGS